ncbi:MAG TPA: hypothetical protein VG708_13155 [Mycobacteriales bacterium]|nr:hypothetical protein [Mycobacteriales bacterium]
MTWRALGAGAAVVMVSAMLAVGSAASAGPASPAPAASTVYTVSCDNGQTYQLPANGDGTATLGGLPAGTVCAVTGAAGDQPPLLLPPVPAGGVASGTFDGPFLRTSPSVGYAGFTTHVSGQGFPPSSTVTLSWNVPGDPATLAQTDAAGNLETSMLVPAGDPAGARVLRATAAGEPVVRASYLVQPSSFAPLGASGQEFRQ